MFPRSISLSGFTDSWLRPPGSRPERPGVWAAAPDRPQRSFHRHLTIFMPMVLLLVGYLHFVNTLTGAGADAVTTGLAILGILPFALLLEMVFRFNFLNIGTQKNLVYAVSVIFLALLYLSLVRRAALWLEPLLPPEATAAILVFLLVIFIEPLQRVIAKRLREAAQSTMDRVQKLMVEIQMEARQGNRARLAFLSRGACGNNSDCARCSSNCMTRIFREPPRLAGWKLCARKNYRNRGGSRAPPFPSARANSRFTAIFKR